MPRLSTIRQHSARGWARIASPVRPHAFRSALATLTPGVDILMVHSAFGRCGYFTAGPEDVLTALRAISNTLVLPTFTYGYPEAVGFPGPVFDPFMTPSQTGLLTEIFRKQPDVTRSAQATHSVAAAGTGAAQICAGHERQDSPCGKGTPFERLVQRRASALLLGVSFHSYTFFHTAEDASGSLFAYEAGIRDRLRVRDAGGHVLDCWTKRQSRAPRRFAEAGVLLEQAGLVRRAPLGRDFLLFVPDVSLAHEFLLERLARVPDWLYRSCSAPLA